MPKRVSVAQAKAQFSTLVGHVAYGGDRIVIERRGKPLAALVGIGDLERLEAERAGATEPRGALALVGAWREVEDRAVDALVAEIYAERERDTGRPVSVEP